MKKETWLIFISIAALALFVYFGTPMFAPRIETFDKVEPFWVVDNDDNTLTVFNLTLDQSTLADAQKILGNRLGLSIFEDGESVKLEGYFRETRVGKFTGRVAFTLNAPTEMLVTYSKTLQRPVQAQVDNTIRFQIPSERIAEFDTYTLHSLAFIPTGLSLRASDITARFGETEQIITEKALKEKEAVTHYLYPARGIDVAIDPSGRALIQYISPQFFDKELYKPLIEAQNRK